MFLGCFLTPCPATERVHSTLPLATSRQRSDRLLPSGLADCTNRRSPQTTGDELPSPGMGVRQSIPSLGVHCVGISLSPAVPLPLGPRNRGHGAADKVQTQPTITVSTQTSLALMCSSPRHTPLERGAAADPPCRLGDYHTPADWRLRVAGRLKMALICHRLLPN